MSSATMRHDTNGAATAASILIVNDPTAGRGAIVTALNNAGYIVLEAATGQQAFEVAETRHPDLIIIDILTPTMDGHELMLMLRGTSLTADIPVAFRTATYSVEELRRLADACGVSEIIIEPCASGEIVRQVDVVISSPRGALAPLRSDEFHREYFRLLNSKLLERVEELRDAVIGAGVLHERSRRSEEHTVQAAAPVLVDRSEPEDVLSRRQLEVLTMIAEGARNSEIAERLVIAPATVQSHVSQILRRLGVRNRTEATARHLRR